MKCPYCDGTGEVEASFSSRLRALRNKSGETQDVLAKAIHTSRPQLANLESGRSGPSLEVLLQIAEHYSASTDWLLGRSDNGPV